jgi:tRNA(Arg) A34 adenosine deaminase TadA
MTLALKEAKKAEAREAVPVGAVVVRNGEAISAAGNETLDDPTAHAEILAIRGACLYLKTPVLCDCDIYVTLEPCAMCAQAISLARIRRLYFGAYDIKYGAVEQKLRVFDFALWKPEIVGGILETPCARVLQDFFEKKRTGEKDAKTICLAKEFVLRR